MAKFLNPMLILFIKIFPIETEIPSLYGLKTRDLNFYLLFSMIVIFA